MKVYCTNCGETIDENVNFCPYCGVSLTDSNDNSGSETNEWSDTAKTAATVGGAVLGAYTLSSLLRRMTHRRPPHPHHPPHRHGGHGHGPGPGGRGHR